MSPVLPQSVIDSCQKMEVRWGIPASVLIAQWIVESSWGRTVTGKNNYGGITAKVSGATFPSIPGHPLEPATLCWTHEVVHGTRVHCQRWFKDFDTPDEFFEAHARLLAKGTPYVSARAKLAGLGRPTEPRGVEQFIGRMAPKYATAPDYGEVLLNVIRKRNLYQYDMWARSPHP